MGILDLSLVTKTLINLLTYYFSAAPEMLVNDPTVSSQRPDQLSGNAVGLYLYHICEDPHYKNLPAPENYSAPIQYSAMGLQLYYQLVAQYLSEPESPESAIYEQNLMGIAMKALHDFPLIDEKTKVLHKTQNNKLEEISIFVDSLKGTDTRLRIELLNLDHKEAMNYWGTSQTAPRLAAYYKVSIVLLKPEPPATHPGRVLSFGVDTFVGSGPRIDGCSNTLSYLLPGQSTEQQLELKPAQVPLTKKVSFNGSGFSWGRPDFLLRNEKWGSPVVINPTDWHLVFSDKGASILIQEEFMDDNNKPVHILPGIYSACIQVTKKDSGGKPLKFLSNECPFAISANITTPNITANPGALVDIEGSIFSFKVPDIKDPTVLIEQISLKVYVGNSRYPDATGPGAYTVETNPVTLEGKKIILHLKADLVKGLYPVRIFTNGIESPPFWIIIPL